MPVKMKPTSVIISNLGLEPKGRVHKFFTHTCAIYMDRYVPYREGTLATTVVENGVPTSKVSTSQIHYDQPYASYVYYGISKSGKQMHYTKSMHKDAGPHWDERMWSANKKKIVDEVQDYMRRK